MSLSITHYFDHAEHCKKCKTARDKVDPLGFLYGDESEAKELFQHSCDQGKDMLVGFIMELSKEEE